MPIQFWRRKDRQGQSGSEHNPYARLDDPMLMDLLGRIAQLTGLLDCVANSLNDMTAFHQEVVRQTTAIAENASLQHEWFASLPAPGSPEVARLSLARPDSLLTEAAELSRSCAHRSIRILEGVQSIAEMAEQNMLVLLHSYPEPATESNPQKAHRNQLVVLAERTSQRSSEVINLLHQLGQNQDDLRKLIHICQDGAVDEASSADSGRATASLQMARERAAQIRSMAVTLMDLAHRQIRNMEQAAPVAETLKRDAAEIRKLVEALIAEGTAATIT